MVIFFFLNRIHSYRTKSKLVAHRKVFENKNICGILMPGENKILEFV